VVSIIYELDLSQFKNVITDEQLINTKKIRKLTISKHISKLPIGAFSSCQDLKKVYIEPDSLLVTIPQYAFSGCKALSKINQLPESLISIDAYAFLNTNLIGEIIIPSSVDFVDQHAFDGWTEDQTIYSYKNFVLAKECKAKLVHLNQEHDGFIKDDNIFIEDGLKFFIVSAKCGHVGRSHYIPIDFPTKATDAKTAAQQVKKIGRVKHDHKDAILKVTQVSKKEYLEQSISNKNDPYLAAKSKHEQNEIIDLIKNRFINDPQYKPKKNKKFIVSKKSKLSSNYKKQKINKELISD